MRKPNPGDCDWTDARVAALSELWLAGIASSECSRQLGVSRSAVMGKLRRLGLLRRDRPGVPTARRVAQLLKNTSSFEQRTEKRPHKRNKRRVTKPVTPPLPPSPPPPLKYGTLNLLDLRHHSCRWPEGDGPIYVFCGRPQAPNSSYCPEHHVRSMSGLARGVPYLSRSVVQA